MGKYVYPAIFTKEENGSYSVLFPDFENSNPHCYTCGSNLAEALEMAKDALSLALCQIEDNKREIPSASDQHSIELSSNQDITLILADTLVYRKAYSNKAVNKTLTLPAWLNTMAEQKGINFSFILQKALKKELNITE